MTRAWHVEKNSANVNKKLSNAFKIQISILASIIIYTAHIFLTTL